jgi:hypothetical protein
MALAPPPAPSDAGAGTKMVDGPALAAIPAGERTARRTGTRLKMSAALVLLLLFVGLAALLWPSDGPDGTDASAFAPVALPEGAAVPSAAPVVEAAPAAPRRAPEGLAPLPATPETVIVVPQNDAAQGAGALTQEDVAAEPLDLAAFLPAAGGVAGTIAPPPLPEVATPPASAVVEAEPADFEAEPTPPSADVEVTDAVASPTLVELEETAATEPDQAPAEPLPPEPAVIGEIADPTPEGPVAPESTTDDAPSEASETALVAASPDGTPAPGGYRVVQGRPATMPDPRPDAAPVPDPATSLAPSPQEVARREELVRIRPTARPAAAVPPVAISSEPEPEPSNPALEALRALAPTPRPASLVAAAAAPEAEALTEPAAEPEPADAAVEAARQAAAASLASTVALAAPPDPTSALALAQSDRPRTRPRTVEREAARIANASAATTAPPQTARVETNQQIRSAGGNVARAATDQNVIRLNNINLIGVYGRPSNRRALVRLPNGRFVKVEVGDELDRGRVTAIGENQISYQQGGRNVVLRLPSA